MECDEKTNHVVSLDLSESCIYGSINSNITLFRLVHLQTLNLGSNDFIHSQIPSEIGQLSRLTHLDLSFPGFSGFSAEIPAEISNLSILVSLDLSHNLDFISSDGLLKLRQTSFRGLVQNMTNLKELDLECVDISSTVLANLSSLESLHLCGCELHGEFPASIFSLLNLKIINLCENINLTCFLPDFHPRSHLERLRLFSTSFYGKVPPSIGNLTNLVWLDLSDTLHNSTSSLSWIGRLTQLTYLGLAAWRDDCKLRMISISYNQLQGQVPKSLANCSSLQLVDFGNNQITDTFPSWLGNLVELRILILRSNHFYGVIHQKPKTKGFPSLRIIDLSGNGFIRKLPSLYLDMWEAMKSIQANHMTYMGENIRPNFTDVDTYYREYDYSMTMFNKGVKLEYDKIQDIFLAIDPSNNRFQGKIP
ncbi:receptor-like protein 7 [Manihot esculenta]|uniref:receptor-like protein 7 n=1 Tax=Manihot esculenta TaxID=3983 RepID=UPI001CC61606|nr:receptor-like protein 7 [Manihot esculenta]